MEKIRGDGAADTELEKKSEGGRFTGGIASALRRSFSVRGAGAEAPIYDAAVFVLSFLFARCHVIFGAYPLAIGVIAVLPSRVWLAVLGSVTGALTLGKAGVIYSMISAIVAFLRVIISATDKKRGEGEPTLFRESLTLRMSCALIGGFIAAIYEILLSSVSLAGVLFGISMIILPPATSFALSGLFGAGISPSAVFFAHGEIFSLKRLKDKERFAMMFFRCSALFGVFIISISLGAYELFGISAGFVFSSLAALFTARRFGALPGAAVGFVSSVGLSGIYAPAFTLAGIISGALHSLGIIPSVIISGAALSVWGGYVGGATGLLSVFPEYAIAAAISVPLLKRTRLEQTADEIADASEMASDMVGTMALSFKSRYSGGLDMLESAFSSVAGICREMRERDTAISQEELLRLSGECINRYFDTEGIGLPGAENARELFAERIGVIVKTLASGKRISREELDVPPHLMIIAGGICEAINRAVGIISEEAYREKARDTAAEDLEHISKLINEARINDYTEKSLNERLVEAASQAISSLGISGAAVQVFGERRPHFIIAMEDESGSVISSAALRSALEDATGVRLGSAEFYRKGRMALMECEAQPRLCAEAASVGAAMSSEASGDTARCFSSREHRSFSLISDGMGSGDDAVRTSGFVADFLERTLEFGRGAETSLRLLNGILKRRRRECSATVDLFTVDLISGDATFHKCGAAPSYIKRGSSLFRIRSRTSPIGLSSELDAERIRVELEPGDMIVMFSDGVSGDGEAPWLLDAISLKEICSPRELCDAVLAAAKRNAPGADDMSVMVTRISSAETAKK